jgi:DME family drug/metabolite transporter
LINLLFALVPAFIWAVSPIYYRVFLQKFDFLSLNFLRTSLSALVLLVPAIYVGFNGSVYYALLSGAVTLAVGDSLFLLSIGEIGASIATPVICTYILFVQLTASFIGEVVPAVNFVSAGIVIAGVYVLSRGGGGRPRAKGIAMALGGAVAWTIGQSLVGVATEAHGNVVTITFARNLAGAIALGIAMVATGRHKKWPRLSTRQFGFVASIALTDLVIGSLTFVYSVSLIGVALTVIVLSVSPFLTQVLSKAMGKESPSNMDILGGILILSALILVVAFG